MYQIVAYSGAHSTKVRNNPSQFLMMDGESDSSPSSNLHELVLKVDITAGCQSILYSSEACFSHVFISCKLNFVYRGTNCELAMVLLNMFHTV